MHKKRENKKSNKKGREGTAEEDSTRQSRDRSGSQASDLCVCCCGVIVQRTESSNKSATGWRRTRIPSTEGRTCKQSTVKQQKENYFNNGGSTNSLSHTHENMGKATRSSEKTGIPWRRQGYSTTSHDAYEISDPHTATCRSSQTCASRSGNVHVPDFQEAGERCRPHREGSYQIIFSRREDFTVFFPVSLPMPETLCLAVSLQFAPRPLSACRASLSSLPHH